MGRLNIYIPDPLAEQLKGAVELNVSAVCQQALAKEIHKMVTIEALVQASERLVLDMGDHDVVFQGQFINLDIGPLNELDVRHTTDSGHEVEETWKVAVTAKRQIAVYRRSGGWGYLKVLPDLDAARHSMPLEVFTAAKEGIGERVTLELDI